MAGMNRFLRSLIDGAIGGVSGTIAMTAVVVAARALGGARPPMSRRVLSRALSLTHLDRFSHADLSDRIGGARGVSEHLGLGLGLGAIFGGLAYATRAVPIPTPAKGAIFGGLLFAAHRLGVVPAPSFLDPDDASEPLTAPASLAAHLAFGAALGVTVARIAPMLAAASEDEEPAAEPAIADAPAAEPSAAAPAAG